MTCIRCKPFVLPLLLMALAALRSIGQETKIKTLSADDGYRGIWYMNQPSKDAYKYKYSGGLATYPQQHMPIAIYSKEANKTFFCYGGRPKDKNELLHMVSYYDHATGTVPRPRILLRQEDRTTPTTTRRCRSTTKATSGSSPTPTARLDRPSSTRASSRMPSTRSSWSGKPTSPTRSRGTCRARDSSSCTHATNRAAASSG